MFMIELAVDTCFAHTKAGTYLAFERSTVVNHERLPCLEWWQMRMVLPNTQASDSLIEMINVHAHRQPHGDASVGEICAECRHESHGVGAKIEVEQHPDMCDPDDAIHMDEVL